MPPSSEIPPFQMANQLEGRVVAAEVVGHVGHPGADHRADGAPGERGVNKLIRDPEPTTGHQQEPGASHEPDRGGQPMR